MQEAYADLLARDTPSGAGSIAAMASNGRVPLARDGRMHPRIATMGGDHSIVLPILRALHDVYGPVTVLHWDSHLDSWAPTAYGKASQSSQGGYNHGTMVRDAGQGGVPSLSDPSSPCQFYHAAQEGLVSNSSMHVGLRSLLSGTDFSDYAADGALGFTYIETDEMDDLGAEGTVAAIRARVGDSPVYLSLDMCVARLVEARGENYAHRTAPISQ